MLYNTLGLRFIALFIDNMILLPLALLDGRGEKMTLDLVTITTMILMHSYFIIGYAQYGRTIGKKIMGLKVVSAHQHLPITWMQAIRREFLWIIRTGYIAFLIANPDNTLNKPANAAIVLSVPIIADALLALIHPQNRSLRDFIGGTVVIRHRDINPS
jgi:uncharacterized RDD family membrane protein YckC